MEPNMDHSASETNSKANRMKQLIFQFRRELFDTGMGNFLRKYNSDTLDTKIYILANISYFLSVYKRLNFYNVAIAVKVLLNLTMSVIDMFPLLDDTDFEAVLNFLARRESWFIIAHLIDMKPHLQFEYLFFLSSLKSMSHPDARIITKRLLARCQNPDVMRRTIMVFCKEGDSELVEMAIARDVLNLEGIAARCKFTPPPVVLLSWPDIIIFCILPRIEVSQNETPFMKVLSNLIELGLGDKVNLYVCLLKIQVYHPGLSRAKLLHLLKFLYRSGMLVNPTVVTQYARVLLDSQNADPHGTECVHYLQRAARHVRRLEDLCIFAVSRCVGSRADRKDRISRLQIPETLKEDLLFKRVIQDFLSENDEPNIKDPPMNQVEAQ